MTQEVEASFVKQYEDEVHTDYQRRGSKLRNTIRTKTGIVGESTTFQRVGKGSASGKTRHGRVPVMNTDRTPVLCTLSDRYAGDWVDKLDELKVQHSERQVTQQAGSYALGRDTDEIIITDALSQGSLQVVAGNAGMTLAKAMEAISTLGSNDVEMEDGNIYCFVGWLQWTELMQIDQFSNADYVPASEMPFGGKGMFAKYWSGAMWMPHSGLPITAGDIRSCYMYHRSSCGHAIGADVSVDITWQGLYAAWFVNHMMSHGACLIQDEGLIEILCDESPT